MTDIWWDRLRQEVIDTGLCTQCGACVGLSEGQLAFKERKGIPVPTRISLDSALPKAAYDACPARSCNYPALNKFVFGHLPENWLSGVTEGCFVGHASDEHVRRTGASGGVISQVLIHLLETKKVTGVVCLQLGKTVPYRAEPVIARTREEVLKCAQSIYSLTPVNTILDVLGNEEGPLAYVGLPDQVASIRKLQMENHPSVKNIEYVLGPYMGTQMYFEAIRSFLRSHDVKSEEEIVSLQYRAGEWPGALQIVLKDGRTLQASKFHYNYLIPFFITKSSLQLVDFTNELTDISVGDAWSPKYESKRGGYSVVLGRTPKAMEILEEMRAKNILSLEPIPLQEALDMHGHMLDFKKRGSFIRMSWKQDRPDYGYEPTHIPFSRRMIERVLWVIFGLAGTRPARWIVEHIPLSIVGPVFNSTRQAWKSMSKPTKRKGLREMKFTVNA